MKNTYVNRLMMWRSLHQYLAGKDPVWNTNEPFSSAVSKLVREIAAADAVLDAQNLSVTVVSDRRKTLFGSVYDKVKAISSSATAYAVATANDELRNLVRLNKSKLEKARLLTRLSIFRGVLNSVEPYLSALAPYGIGSAEMAAANAALQALDNVVVAPQHHLRTRAAVLGSVADVFRRGHNALLEMDNLIYLFRDTAPEFVAGFHSHRKVNNRVGRHKPGEGGDAEAA